MTLYAFLERQELLCANVFLDILDMVRYAFSVHHTLPVSKVLRSNDTCSEQADIDFTRFARGLRKCEVVAGFDIVDGGGTQIFVVL